MSALDSIINFFTSINYFGWQDNVKIIFLALTFVFLFIAIFSYIKASLIMKEHHEHMLHEHAHASGEGHGEHDEHGAEHDEHGETSTEHATDNVQVSHHWDRVVQYVNSTREAEWKLAVIEGDKYVDDVLKEKGFPGESMGERLMLLRPNEFASLQDLWDAHKLRNLLVHEASYQIKHDQALAAIQSFERALRELGALQ